MPQRSLTGIILALKRPGQTMENNLSKLIEQHCQAQVLYQQGWYTNINVVLYNIQECQEKQKHL